MRCMRGIKKITGFGIHASEKFLAECDGEGIESGAPGTVVDGARRGRRRVPYPTGRDGGGGGGAAAHAVPRRSEAGAHHGGHRRRGGGGYEVVAEAGCPLRDREEAVFFEWVCHGSECLHTCIKLIM